MSFDVEKDLIFNLVKQKPKTVVYEVKNKITEDIIGVIEWYPSWRYYCFFPVDGTVFSDRCMIKIGVFVEELNNKHKLGVSEKDRETGVRMTSIPKQLDSVKSVDVGFSRKDNVSSENTAEKKEKLR